MSQCIDTKYETMIHAYELGVLSEKDREAFELHLLECESCFEAVRGFEDSSRLLRSDADVRSSVEEILDEGSSLPSRQEGSGERSSVWMPRWVPVAVIAAAAVLLIVLKPWHIEIHPTDDAVASGNRLAVVPFENLVEPEDRQQLGRIVARLLVSDLAESEFVDVVSSQHLADVSRLVSLENESIDSVELRDRVLRKVDARWRVTGSIVQLEPCPILVADLFDIRTDSLLASKTIACESGQDVFAIVDMLTREVRGNLPLPISAAGEYDPRVAEVTTHSPEAYRHYLEGLDAYSRMYLDEARIHFRRALEFDSTFAMAHFRYTLCLPTSQRPEAIARAVRHSEGISKRERLLIEALNASVGGDYDLYIEKLRTISEEYPDEKEVVYWLGTYHFSLAKYEEAVSYLRRAVDIDPLYKNPYNLLAYAYGRSGDSINSIWAINRYIELAPGEANPYDSRGDLYLLSGNAEEALESFQKAVEIRRDFADYSPLTKIGRLHLLAGRFDEARAIFQELAGAESEGARARGRFMLAYVPLRQGQFTRALEILDRAITADEMEHARELYPTNHLHKALVYQQTGRPDSAVREMEQHNRIYAEVHQDTTPPNVHVYAQVLAESGQPDRARSVAEAARQTLEADGDNLTPYWTALGAIEIVRGDPEQAAVNLERASQMSDYSVAVNYLLGRAYLEDGRPGDAARIFESLHSYFGDGRTFWGTWDVNSHYYLSLAYEKLGRTPEAIEQLERFLSFWQDSDHDLAEVRDATERLTRLKSSG
ncbi:MAG: tetratricopeptide repeat protein [bacterium]|nr:tetratricopeptide repeat protein [bacterium]